MVGGCFFKVGGNEVASHAGGVIARTWGAMLAGGAAINGGCTVVEDFGDGGGGLEFYFAGAAFTGFFD